MSKNKKELTVTLNRELDQQLNKLNFNKSGLVNSLLNVWLKTKENLKDFQKKS